MRYVVTGGLGFIGSRLASRLLAAGHSVTVLDARRQGSGEHMPAAAEIVRADVTDRDATSPVVRSADGVFHLAALVPAAESVSRPDEYERVNVGGTRVVLGAAAAAGIPAVLASSAAVYGRPGGERHCRPLSEGGPCAPASPYGRTKLGAEKVALGSGAAVACLRYFNVYGPSFGGRPGGTGVVSQFAARLAGGRAPVVSGAGMQVRDYVHVDDVVVATLRAAEWAAAAGGRRPADCPPAVFNVGTGRGTTVLSIARAMIRMGRPGGPADLVFGPAVRGDVEYSVADTRLTREVLGWEHRVRLEEGLRGLLARCGEGATVDKGGGGLGK